MIEDHEPVGLPSFSLPILNQSTPIRKLLGAMGKRSAPVGDENPPRAKPKAKQPPVSELLGVSVGPNAEEPPRDDPDPDPQERLPAYHLWRMQVLEESRSYYAQRSDTWMRVLYERCLGYVRHPLVDEFFDAPQQKQLRTLPWRVNPKETCDRFHAFVVSKTGDNGEPAAEGPLDADMTAEKTEVVETEAIPPNAPDTPAPADVIHAGSSDDTSQNVHAPLETQHMDVPQEAPDTTVPAKVIHAGSSDETSQKVHAPLETQHMDVPQEAPDTTVPAKVIHAGSSDETSQKVHAPLETQHMDVPQEAPDTTVPAKVIHAGSSDETSQKVHAPLETQLPQEAPDIPVPAEAQPLEVIQSLQPVGEESKSAEVPEETQASTEATAVRKEDCSVTQALLQAKNHPRFAEFCEHNMNEHGLSAEEWHFGDEDPVIDLFDFNHWLTSVGGELLDLTSVDNPYQLDGPSLLLKFKIDVIKADPLFPKYSQTQNIASTWGSLDHSPEKDIAEFEEWSRAQPESEGTTTRDEFEMSNVKAELRVGLDMADVSASKAGITMPNGLQESLEQQTQAVTTPTRRRPRKIAYPEGSISSTPLPDQSSPFAAIYR